MSIMDEVLAAEEAAKPRCGVCVFLETLDPSVAAEFDEVMRQRSRPSTAILRVMRNRGFERGEQTVSTHRKANHRVPTTVRP